MASLDSDAGGCWPTPNPPAALEGSLCVNTKITSPTNCSETFRCVCEIPPTPAPSPPVPPYQHPATPLAEYEYYGPITQGTCETHPYGGLRSITSSSECLEAATQVFPGKYKYTFFTPFANLDADAGGCWPTPDPPAELEGSLCVNTKITSPTPCSEKFQCICKVVGQVARKTEPYPKFVGPITSGTCEDAGLRTIVDAGTCLEAGHTLPRVTASNAYKFTFYTPFSKLNSDAGGCWPTPNPPASLEHSLCVNTKVTSPTKCSDKFKCLCEVPRPQTRRFYGPVKSGTCEDVGLKTIVDTNVCMDAGRQLFPGKYKYTFLTPFANLDSDAGGCWPTPDPPAELEGSLCVNTKITSPTKCSEKFQCICEIPPVKQAEDDPIPSAKWEHVV